MTKSNQSSLDIADHLGRGEYDWCPEAETRLREQHDKLRLQQAEIDTYKSQNDSQIDTYRYKELTDEEIKSEAKYFCHSWHSQNPERLVLFARAILRKAQEK